MSSRSDAWYVRLPDGRVMRAANTRSVRHHLESGRIPPDSRVRRSADEEWAGLEWTQEFADLVKGSPVTPISLESSSLDLPAALTARGDAAGIASRLDPFQLQTVGVRGYVDELLGALDSTLVRNKLLIAAVGAVLAAAVFVLCEVAFDLLSLWQMALMGGSVLVLIAVSCSALITQMCYVELCKLRPARWKEARQHYLRNVIHLTLASFIVVGGSAVAIYALRYLPTWLLVHGAWPENMALRQTVTGAAAAAAVILEVACWLIVVFALLLAPIVVIEDASFLRAIFQWLGLLRRHVSRTFLYEALAVVPALVITAGLLLPVQWATHEQAVRIVAAAGTLEADSRSKAAAATDLPANWIAPVRRLLQGFAVAPMLAFLAVANVFIYLNLRYEQEPRTR